MKHIESPKRSEGALVAILANEGRIGANIGHNLVEDQRSDEACERGLTLTTTNGTINSPNYPHLSNRTSCQWLIKALRPDHIITIRFEDLNF